MAPYLIKTALCLILFYLAYRLLLNHKCPYPVSRIYLISSFVLSFLFPLITINLPLITLYNIPSSAPAMPLYADSLQANSGLITPDLLAEERTGRETLISFFAILYIVGILIFTIRYGMDIFRLVRMIRSNQKQVFKDYTLVKINRAMAPFSFFRYVFVSEKDLASEDFHSFILKHELAHIRAWHSLDRLFIGIGQIIQWFNPVTLLYKKSLITLHELCADYAAIHHADTIAGYRRKLVQYAYEKNNLVLTSHFSNTITKKRFIMMTKRNNGQWNALRVFMAAVIAAFLLLAFSSGDKIMVKESSGEYCQPASAVAVDSVVNPVVTGDTTRNHPSNKKDTSAITGSEETAEDQESRILSDELREMKEHHGPDSEIRRFSHEPVNPEMLKREMEEQRAFRADQERHVAELHRHFAEQERLRAEQLKRLKERELRCLDEEQLKKIAEAQARIEAIKPMLDEYLMRNPPPCPVIIDKDFIIPEHIKPMIKEHMKVLTLPCPDQFEPLQPLSEKDKEMLEKQKQWQEKYNKEMEKQRRQMKEKQDQLLKEYKEMMKKYRPES